MIRRRFWKGLHKSRAASLRYARRVENALKLLTRIPVAVAQSVSCSLIGTRMLKVLKWRYRVAVAVAGMVFLCVPSDVLAHPGEISVATVAGIPSGNGSVSVSVASGYQDTITVAGGLQDIIGNFRGGAGGGGGAAPAGAGGANFFNTIRENMGGAGNAPGVRPGFQLPIFNQPNGGQQNPGQGQNLPQFIRDNFGQPSQGNNGGNNGGGGGNIFHNLVPNNHSYPTNPNPTQQGNSHAAFENLKDALNLPAPGASNTPGQANNRLGQIFNNIGGNSTVTRNDSRVGDLLLNLGNREPGAVRHERFTFALGERNQQGGGSGAGGNAQNAKQLIFSIGGTRSEAYGTPATSGAPPATNSAEGIDFNLQSMSKVFVADISSSVTITVGGRANSDGTITGGTSKTINPGDSLTAAEYAAVHQVASGGQQTLAVNALGAATSGYLTLSADSGLHIDDLRVPYNVQLNVVGYTDANPLSISGDARIAGSVYSLQNSANTGAVINADSVHVTHSGQWSGSAPTDGTATGTYSSTSMTFNVDYEVANLGKILSPGELTINAGGSVLNEGSSALIGGSSVSLNVGGGVTNSGQVIASSGPLNINTGAGSIVNSGLIQATAGDINISTPTAVHLNIDNTDGTFRAGNDINIGNPNFTVEKIDTTLTGGDWYSQRVNIVSGDGHIFGNVGDVTGQVNMKGGLAHFYADTADLNLGDITITGDPAYANTGNITLTGVMAITGGAPLAIIAGGDVLSEAGAQILTSGGDLTVIAGANYTVGASTITVTGPKSPDGGKIDFSTNAVTAIDTRGTGAGGDVTLIAFDGEGLNSGRILLPTNVTIQTAGVTGTAGGDVTIIAADRNASSNQSIVMGGVNTYGGTGGYASNNGTGNVTIAASDIVMTGPLVINTVGATAGQVMSGGFTPGANQPRGVNINGPITTNGGDVDLRAGATANSPANALRVNGAIDTSSKTAGGIGGDVSINIASANTFVVGNPATNGVTSINTSGGSASGSAGNISIVNNSTGGITVTNSTNIQGTTTLGDGAILYLNANSGNLSLGGGVYNFGGRGAGGDGGRIELRGANVTFTGGTSILDASGSTTGDGGEVIVVTTSSTSDLIVGNGAGQFQITAGGANGGTVNVTAGNNLTVLNTGFINAGPTGLSGNGANIHLEAGAGTAVTGTGGRLNITGSLNVSGGNGGDGGSIELVSNSDSVGFRIGSSTVNGISGSLNANGGISGGNAGTISVVNRGDGGIQIGDPGFLSAMAFNGNGGSITLESTTGEIRFLGSASGFNVAGGGAGGDGGSVVIRGTQIITPGTIAIAASGSGTGDGGNVVLEATGASSDITLGAGVNSFSISAIGGNAGGDGGDITITAGRNITVASGTLATQAFGNGDGGVIRITAGLSGQGNLSINTSLSANGAGTGDGGEIYLTSASNTAFNIGPTLSANGITGTLTATGGNGGTISVVNNGTAGANGGINVENDFNALNVSAFNGAGGTIILDAASSTNPDGNIVLPGGTLTNQGSGANGDGGTVKILGNELIVTTNGGHLTINTDGIGTGDGGTIYVETTSNSSNLTVGPGAGLELRASGANGGSISVLAGNDLRVIDTSFITANNSGGAGGHYRLEAGNSLASGTGNLQITGSLNASGTTGGSIRLVSESGQTFFVNSATGGNHISGTLDAHATSGSGGTVEVINRSGGINVGSTANINVAAAGNGDGGRIYLDAGGVLTIPVSTGLATFNAAGVGNGAGGTIDLRGSNVNVTGPEFLRLNASGAGNGDGGTVRIYETGTSGITVGDDPGNFCINVRSGLTGGDGGTVDLRSQGTITIDPACLMTNPQSANGDGAHITLYAGNQGCGGAQGNLVITGNLIADGVGTGRGGVIDIGVNSTSVFNISVMGPNGVTGFISARGGSVSGDGGEVYVKNYNTGGIALTKPTDILVTATNGNGGIIDLDAAACGTNQGAVTIATVGGNSVFDASGRSNNGGTYNGGTINVRGTQVNVGGTGGSLTFDVDGTGSGNGGTIHITATSATNGDVNIGTGTNDVILSATSGTIGGNGGTIIIDAARNLTADSTQFNVTPSLAGNGNGGSIYLHAGTSGAGLLQIDGDITANGVGTGRGGIVEITLPMNSSTGNLLVGATGAANQSWISGDIEARALGSGTGGTITMRNTSASDFNIDLTSSINAGSASGLIGEVNFQVQNGAAGSGQDINVLSAPGSGNIAGFVNATANRVVITANAVNETLNAGVITGTDGQVILTAANTGGQIRVGEGRRVSATQDIRVTTNMLTVNGEMTTSQANGLIDIRSLGDLTIVGEGIISTTNGTGANLIDVHAATGSDLYLNSNINYVPTTSASTVRFAAEGPTGEIFVAGSTTQVIQSGATLKIDTPFLHLGNASGFNATGASLVTITPGLGSENITIETTGTGTIATNNGSRIEILGDAGRFINFTHTGAGQSTLNLNGAPVHVSAQGAGGGVSVANNQIVSSNNNICIELDGGTSLAPSRLINNGTIRSTSTTSGATINIGPGHPTTGSNTNYVSMEGTGTVALTNNPANGFIQVHAFDDKLTISGTQTLNAGTGTGSRVNIGGYETDAPGVGVELADNAVLNVTANAVNVFTYGLQFGEGSSINSLRSGTAVNVQHGTITACDGSTITGLGPINVLTEGTGTGGGTISTNNGNINFNTGNAALIFDTSTGAAATLNLNAGTGNVTTTNNGSQQSIDTNTTLQVRAAQMQMNVNNGIFNNDGTLQVNRANGNAGYLTIQSTGTLDVPKIANISVNPITGATSANGGRIDILANGQLSIANGTLSANATAVGALTNGNGGEINVRGSSILVTAGDDLNITTNAIGNGNGGVIRVTATGVTGDITTGAGSSQINLQARGSGTNGNGGSVTVSAGRNLTLDGSAVDVSAGTSGNGGRVTVTASTAVTNGVLDISTPINANAGAGGGDGGQIIITNNSTQALTIDQALNVNSAGTGAGGRIEIRNEGGGNIDVQTALRADSTGNNAGTIIIDADSATGPDGTVILDPQLFSASTTGAGNGGSITIEGGELQFVGSGAKNIVANAGTAGDGGSIFLNATNATGNITLDPGAGGLTLSARGGTGSGNGGSIELRAGNDIRVNGNNTVLDVSPRAADANGGTIILRAGQTDTTGVLQVNGELNADGTGTGNGGTITLNYRDPAGGNFVVGSTSTGSYVSGTIHANAGGAGNGGTINFSNANGAGTSVGDMNIVLTGSTSLISAGSTNAANLGTLNFSNAGNDVHVYGDAAGSGTLTGRVDSIGTSVIINPLAVDTTVTVGTIRATGAGGIARVDVNCEDNSQIVVTGTSSVISDQDEAQLDGHLITIDNGGVVQGQTNVRLEQDILAVNGRVTAVNGSVYIDACNLGENLNVSLNSTGRIEANNGNIAFNTINYGGTIDVTGAGVIGTNPNGEIIFGNILDTNTVNATAYGFGGSVTGAGTTINITAQNGNLNVGTSANSLTSTDGGNISLYATGLVTGGDIIFNGDVTSAGDLLVSTSATNGDVTLNNGAVLDVTGTANINTGSGAHSVTMNDNTSIQGNVVNINAALVDMVGANSTIEAADALNFNHRGGGSITINMAETSEITATNIINFNNNFAGSLTINSPGQGTIDSARINLNNLVGQGAVLISVDTINGPIYGRVSTASITSENGDLHLGYDAIFGLETTSTTAGLSATAQGGDIYLDGNVTSGQNLNLTTALDGTGTVFVGAGRHAIAERNIDINTRVLNISGLAVSSVESNQGTINIRNSVGNHSLDVLIGTSNSNITTHTGGDITFNTTTATGAIKVSGAGYISAGDSATELGHVTFNGGTAAGGTGNPVDVDLRYIHGCIGGTGDDFSIFVQQASPLTGNTHLGNITTNTSFLFDSPGNVVICGPITAIGTNSNITIDADRNSGYSITHEASADVTAGGQVRYLTDEGTVTLNAGADIRSLGSLVNIDAASVVLGTTIAGDNSSITAGGTGSILIGNGHGAHNLLVTMPTGSYIGTDGGDINFNSALSTGAITINGGAGVGNTGTIQSGNTPATIGHVNFNGGTNAVSVGVREITGCIGGSGDPFNVTVQVVSSVTNDVHLGNITTNVDFLFTSPGALTVCGPITANGTGSDITLNTAAGSTLTQESAADVTAGGIVDYNTNGGTISLQTGADIAGAQGVDLDGRFINIGNAVAGNTSVTSSAGDIILRNSNGAHALTVTMNDGSLIQTITGDVRFNVVGAEGTIAVNQGVGQAGNGTILAGDATHLNHVRFNGGLNNTVNVSVDEIHGCIGGTGSPFNIQVDRVSRFTNDVHLGGIQTNVDFSFTSPGALTVCGPITANGVNSDITLTTANGSTLTHEVGADVTAGGVVDYNTGGGTITLGNGADITGGTGVDLDALNIVLGGSNAGDNSSIVANANNVTLHNSATGHVLNVTLPDTSLIQAGAGDVIFNLATEQGQITVNGGSGVGTTGGIIAGTAANFNHVTFNGGLANEVSVGVDYIIGCIGGTGSPFEIDVVRVGPGASAVHLGGIETNADFSFDSPGNLVICGPITANGLTTDITLTTVATGSIVQDPGATVTSGGTTTYVTDTLTLNAQTIAQAINVNNIAGNGATLSVTFNNGGALLANGQVTFNSSETGQGINIIGSPNGTILGSGVNLNGGANVVNVDIGSISGGIAGAGSTVTIETQTGDITVGRNATGGSLTASAGPIIITANGGGINFGGVVTASTNVTANSGDGTVDLTTGAVVTGQNGNINIISLDPTNAPLTVTFATGTSLNTPNGNINFNQAGSEGSITITGDGSILAPGNHVYYNVGPNDLVADIREIQGCNHLVSATNALASVYMETAQGNIEFCTDINTMKPAGDGGDISIIANGGLIDLEGNSINASGGGAGNSGGTITLHAGSGGILNGGDIVTVGSNGANGGIIDITAPGGNVTVNTLQAWASGGGDGGTITTVSANLSVMGCDINGAGIDVIGNNGGIISVTTTSTNPFIVGQPVPNGVTCNIKADGTVNGGHIAITSNGGSVPAGHSVTANGGTGNGGVVTFNPNNPTAPGPIIWNVDGTVSAVGGIPGTGVVGFGAGPGQDMNLTVGRGGSINAGQQITLGNLDPFTGIESGPPAGDIRVRPLRPIGNDPFPNPPFNAPTVVVNGNLVRPFVPPGPPGPGPGPSPTNPGVGGNNGGDFNLFGAFVLGGASLATDATRGLISSSIPTDQTKLWSGYYATDENEEDATRQRQLRKGKVRRIIPGSTTLATAFELGDVEVNRLRTEGVAIANGTKESFFNLNQGNVLFMPNKDIVVGTTEGRVFIPAGSMAFIMQSGNEVAIFDLHQRGKNGIQVVAGDKLITMDPGRMVLLSNQKASSLDQLGHEALTVAYRQPQAEKINDNLTAHGADFSLPSAFHNVQPLQRLLNSERPEERRIVQKLLMNAVLLEEQTNYRGPFRTVDIHP